MLIDISSPLREDLPVWPGSPGFSLTSLSSLESGDAVNVSRLDIEVHTGTHVDAPSHFLPGAQSVEQLPLEVLVGRAEVADLSGEPTLGPRQLSGLELPDGCERLLVKSDNSRLWSERAGEFVEEFTAFSPAGAQWLVERGIRLIGVDYLSVQKFADGPETHRILLAAGVVIVEGLRLGHVEPGSYELLCLPLLLCGAEGAPARAVLRRLQQQGEPEALR